MSEEYMTSSDLCRSKNSNSSSYFASLLRHHTDTLFAYMQQLKASSCFADVVVKCDGEFIASAHRLMLSAYSSHFETALAAIQPSKNITLEVDPKITVVIGVEKEELLEIIDFMYSGRIRGNFRIESSRALGCTSLTLLLENHRFNLQPNVVIEDRLHSQRLLQSFFRYRSENKFIDCTVNCQGIPVLKCHRVLLAAYSSNFESILMTTERCSSVTVDVDMQVTGVSSVDLRSLVDFMYTGFIRTPVRRYRLLRNAALTLGVGRLVEAIDGELALNADQLSSTSCLPQEGFDADEGSGRTFSAVDDYPDIYEEYVSGPRRGRKGGTYGRKQDAITIKGCSVGNIEKYGNVVGQNNDGVAFLEATDIDSFPAVTISFTPVVKRRKVVDSFGYGLPEIVRPHDVTVPLLVGDQRVMMEKPFKCPYCDHRTKEKSAVEKHIRCIHTLEAPYKCHICTQAFKVQSNLVRHIRAHTGEKPYACKKCGTAYADKKNMDAHVFREHLKMKPLECPEQNCAAKFWRHDRFAYHCRKTHGFDPIVTETTS
uniref:BTB domain-containing protein n=1 Tax=Syphacia muris TaxID=451379 RepID=A0A0N5A8A7_9BILA